MQNTALQTAIDELIALNEFGRFVEMETRAGSLAKSFPGVPVVRELLGMALAAQQRFADALPHLKRAVRDEPGDPFFWDNLAFCQRQLGQLEAAEATLREATARHPGSLTAWIALADVQLVLDRPDDARGALVRVLSVQPNDLAAHFMSARIAMLQRRFGDAEGHLHATLAADATIGAAHAELGKLQLWRGDLEQAEARLRHAIALDAGDPAPRANLCRTLALKGDLDSATTESRNLLDQLRADDGGISDQNIEYFDVVAGIFGGGARIGEALGIYRAALQIRREPLRAINASMVARKACDWAFAAELEHLACEVAREGHLIDESVPHRLLWLESASPQVQLAASSRIAKHIADAAAPAVRAAAPRGRERLRVGYYSGDLFSHPVGHLIAGVIEQHDRERFEIVAYDFSENVRDTYRERLERAFDRMVIVGGMPYQVAAQRIADDHPDIVVDLNGWGRRERANVLAARPASVQAQWLGFAGTLGAPWIDYIIADPVVIPPGHERYFSEKIVRLPDSMMPTDDGCPTIPGSSRASHGLPEQALVFCSFNGSFKITPALFEIWMQLLKSVPASVLWLAGQIPEAVAAMRRVATERGVAPERLIFAPTLPTVAEHLARIPLADIALDCFPYGSHTTAVDCMRAGVPLVGLMGDTFASRVSGSVLGAAGVPELVAQNFDDYRALAMRLATQPDELAGLRLRMKELQNSAPLFDTSKFAHHLEAAFEAMWDRHCQGQSPDHISV